jgi:hypothetical protein
VPAPLKWAAAERNDPPSVFDGEKAAAKIRTVKGLRVEIFSRCARKNTTRPLTVRIVGADEIFRLQSEKAVEKFKKLC